MSRRNGRVASGYLDGRRALRHEAENFLGLADAAQLEAAERFEPAVAMAGRFEQSARTSEPGGSEFRKASRCARPR